MRRVVSVLPGARPVEWDFSDACEKGLERTREARDVLKPNVIALLREMGALKGDS
jgi:hypothetical protein